MARHFLQEVQHRTINTRCDKGEENLRIQVFLKKSTWESPLGEEENLRKFFALDHVISRFDLRSKPESQKKTWRGQRRSVKASAMAQ